MADYLIIDTVLDVSLQYLKDNVIKICLCSQAPTDYTGANSTYKLSETGALSGADFTLADNAGAIAGRKVTVDAKNSLAVTSNGTITHAAWVTGSVLLAVTKLTTGRAVTTADTVNMPAHAMIIGDAVVAT